MALLGTAILITSGGLKNNTLFLFAIGGVGIFLNVYVAGCQCHPESNGLSLQFEKSLEISR